MGYYIDYSLITIEEYRDRLKRKSLIPSQMILKDGLEEKFSYFKDIGIENVFELENTLKNKQKLIELAKVPLLSEQYLKVLLREIKGRQPKPRKLKDFEHISRDTIAKLEQFNIKTTAHLYDKVLTYERRKELAEKTSVPYSTILELAQLTDLTRIQWVNTTFARVLYESGYNTIKKVSKADYEILYKEIR